MMITPRSEADAADDTGSVLTMVVSWNIMRCLKLVLALQAVGSVKGTNECLKSTDSRCQAGAAAISFVGCGLADEDVDDLGSCFDAAGRGTITELRLSDTSMTNVGEGLLEGFGALRELRMENNLFSAIPSGLFQDVEALEFLSLQHNELESLPSGMFDGMSHLWSLDLGSNRLTSLPDGLFGTSSGLASLKSLYLNDNALSAVTAECFGGLEAVSTLNLSSNTLSFLPSGFLATLTALIVLTLDSNVLSALPSDIFDGLDKLQILYLNDNALGTLSAGLLADLRSLTSLDLTGNDDLQCVPSIAGTKLSEATLLVPEGVGEMCACPGEGVDASCLDCEPGVDGYTCTAITPQPTSAPTPQPTPAPWNPGEDCLPVAEACQEDPECMECHTVTDQEGWNSCTASINSDEGCVAFGQHLCCLDEQSAGDCSTNDRAQAYVSCITEAAGLQCSPWSCVGETNTSGTGTLTVATDSNNAAASCESLTGWNNFVRAAMIVVGFIVTTMGAK
ncbi:unnamed protein product [Ectocarpus sp. 6 AP-2014]